MTIKLGLDNRIQIVLPDGYDKGDFPLPGVTNWVEALRSGEFKQGISALRDDCNNFCCLGVLSLLQGRLTKIKINEREEIAYADGKGGSLCFLSIDNPLSDCLRQSAFFPPDVFVYFNGVKCVSLVSLNDSGANFEEIAEVIEFLWSEPNPTQSI